jgi:hypothetical protein
MYLDVSPQPSTSSKVSNLLTLGLGREKRSFRRPSEQPCDHSISAALLDAAPIKRQGSRRASKTKKALFFDTMSLRKSV